ncbi:MAG: hypothetical protein ACYTHK_17125 [Planctomycetota bacterium]|jgi:hypothetical protein
MRTRFVAGLFLGAALAAAALYARRWVGWTPAERAMAPRMHAFVEALSQRPRNADPAVHWSPLAREPVHCSVCHDNGDRMQAGIASGELPVGERSPIEHEAMVKLMEKWVRQLNRKADHLLRKAVVCLDCHESDPRR